MSDPSAYIRQRAPRAEQGHTRDLSYPPLPEALTVGVYDNHAHLEISDGDDPLDYREQLDRASSVGIRGVIQVGGDLETSRWSAEMAAREPRMLAAVAIHPNEAPHYASAGHLGCRAGRNRRPRRQAARACHRRDRPRLLSHG